MRIQIGTGHPHAGEYGTMANAEQSAANAEARGGAPRNGKLVNLENCQHGVVCCYVFPGEYRPSAPKRRLPVPVGKCWCGADVYKDTQDVGTCYADVMHNWSYRHAASGSPQ